MVNMTNKGTKMGKQAECQNREISIISNIRSYRVMFGLQLLISSRAVVSRLRIVVKHHAISLLDVENI